MRRRVEEVLDALGVAHLRDRNPAELSGGERQRCAIAGALVTAPEVLVLDEPTSQLDPQGAEDVLAAVARLNADLGTTVVLAEHRLERAAPAADAAVLIADGGIAPAADAAGARARRVSRCAAASPGSATTSAGTRSRSPCATPRRHARDHDLPAPAVAAGSDTREPGPAGRGPRGRARADPGAARRRSRRRRRRRRSRCSVATARARPRCSGRSRASCPSTRGRITGTATRAYVPQDPSSLLFRPTVRAEIAETLRLLGRPDDGAVESWIDALGLRAVADRHPRSLSGGERQRVAIAAVAVGGATVLLLDEPTRGMDAASRGALERAIATHRDTGGAVVLATHDVELAARCATRATVLGDGEVVAGGAAREVLTGSLFAPQIARVVPGYLTVEELAAATVERA